MNGLFHGALVWCTFAAAVLGIALLLCLRSRRRMLAAARLRRLHQIGEHLVSAGNLEEAFRILIAELPGLLGATGARTFLHDPVADSLRPVGSATNFPSIPLSAPSGFRDKVVVLCFRNRLPLTIRDSHSSPLYEQGESCPRSLACAPMLLRGGAVGVLEIVHDTRPGAFSNDAAAMLQHLANEAAVAVSLARREAFKARQLGLEQYRALLHLWNAVIPDIAQALDVLYRRLTDLGGELYEAEAAQLVSKARQEIARLRSIATLANGNVPCDLVSLLKEAVEEQLEVSAGNLESKVECPSEPVLLVGPEPGLLKECLRSALQAALELRQPDQPAGLRIRVTTLAGAAVLEVGWHGGELTDLSTPFQLNLPSARHLLPLSLCRSLLERWGGDIRWVQDPGVTQKFEIELPLASEAAGLGGETSPAGPRHVLTVLVLAPEGGQGQDVLAALAEAGHRAVVMTRADQALSALRTRHFDACFCSERFQGGNWTAVYEESSSLGIPFVLLGSEQVEYLVPGEVGSVPVLSWPGPKEALWNILASLEDRFTERRYNEE